MMITSPRNPLLQGIRRAAASGVPTESGLIVAEGPHLLEEALRGKWKVEQLIVTPDSRQRFAALVSEVDAGVLEVSKQAFEALSSTQTSQGMLALLRPAKWRWEQLMASRPSLTVVLDGIQDPGNAGTIVRSAEAFGATGVVLLQGSVRSANGKFLRATAGSLFRLPVLEKWTAEQLLEGVRSAGSQLYALCASARKDLPEADLKGDSALVVGSEGSGVSATILNAAVGVRIPTLKVESLNAGVACSIALFEASRQRRTR